MTIIALLAILLFYWKGPAPAPNPHLEWLCGIQGLVSVTTLFLYGSWVKSRGKMRMEISRHASPLIGKIEAPCSPIFLYLLPLVSLASLIPPIFADSGFSENKGSEIAVHFLLIAVFFDLFLLANRPGRKKWVIGEEKQLDKYKESINGAVEAALKGIDNDRLTLAEKGLDLLPFQFSDSASHPEYRALYLFDQLEVMALRATDRFLFPYVQEILSRILRLSGNLLPQMPPLSSAGVEVAGRIIRFEIDSGHLDAAEKGLFTFVQGVRGLKLLPTGLGDFLIHVVVELEKGLEALYRADKSRSIKAFFVPLAELKKVFQEERFTSHPETILGERELIRVVDLFKTLETVLLTTPKGDQKMGGAEPESEASSPPFEPLGEGEVS